MKYPCENCKLRAQYDRREARYARHGFVELQSRLGHFERMDSKHS